MKLNDFCVAMAAAIAITASGATYRISAPNGVGDVTALTNAGTQIDAAATSGTRLLLEPGVYNLAGTSTGAGGAWQDWMAPLHGGVDFAGRPRVKFGSIDAGALACQHRLGFVIEVKLCQL